MHFLKVKLKKEFQIFSVKRRFGSEVIRIQTDRNEDLDSGGKPDTDKENFKVLTCIQT